jgi:maleate isomerase
VVVDASADAFAGPPAQTGIGLIVPYDMALDRELWRWLPPDVSLLTTRTPHHSLAVSREMAEAVSDTDEVTDGVRALAAAGPAVYAYGCASGSFVHGVAGESRLVAAMNSAGADAAVTASGAMREALAALGARRSVVVTPYTADLTAALSAYLDEAGVAVVGSAELGLTAGVWTVPYRTTAELIRSADAPAADAVLVSCTNLATYDLIGPLEAELGKPIVTANQALMWSALRRIGHRARGKGQHLVEL